MEINKLIAEIKAGPSDITLYPGATQQLIDEFQLQTGILLPDELAHFYRECNGFESAEDLFRIIPLDEALATRSHDMAVHHVKANQFYIAEYLIYCDMWTIEIESGQLSVYKIIGGTGAVPTVLTHSFAAFLTRFLAGGVFDDGGLYKWEEERIREGSN